MMRKNGVIKRTFCFVLIFLLNINVFAAVISDNDGSAFITKAEFDALRKNFASQIEQYNNSIDSKIDGAIASYLSGIKLDGTKHYRAYGEHFGAYSGTQVNGFYLIGAGTDEFTDGTTKYTTSWGLLSTDASERPGRYGYGFWVTWVNGPSPSYKLTGLPVGTAGYILGQDFWNTSKPYLTYSTSPTPVDGTSSACTYWYVIEDNRYKRLYQLELSEAFEQTIPMYRPKFTLYEFLDKGEVSIKVAKIIDAYHYEGGIHGGREPAGSILPKYQPLFNDIGQFKISKVDGTSTLLKRIGAMTDMVLEDLNFTVEAGDKLVFEIDQNADIYANMYSMLHYSTYITGWELETT